MDVLNFANSVLGVVIGFFMGFLANSWFTAKSEFKNCHPLTNGYPEKKKQYYKVNMMLNIVIWIFLILAVGFLLYALVPYITA